MRDEYAEADFTAHREMEKRGKDALRTLDREMLRAVKNGATYERRFKTYTNRTGNLLRSTQGYAVTDAAFGDASSSTTYILEMGEEYASFVDARGYSAIREAARETENAIAVAVAKAEAAARG